MIIRDKEKLGEIVNRLKFEGKKIVTTNGCFDILHKGHVFYLRESKKYGDVLIVGLNSDSSVKRLKGEDRPINDERSRAIVLDELKSVDYVFIFEEDTPIEFLKIVKPHYHTKGADYEGKNISELDVLKKYGGKMVYIKYLENYSTTNIINKIKKDKENGDN